MADFLSEWLDPARIDARRGKASQAIVNDLSNACKYAPVQYAGVRKSTFARGVGLQCRPTEKVPLNLIEVILAQGSRSNVGVSAFSVDSPAWVQAYLPDTLHGAIEWHRHPPPHPAATKFPLTRH
jgi:hypothetical protein